MKLQFTGIAFIMCMLTFKSIAQPVIQLQKGIGGTNDDVFRNMCLTNDGGLLTGGTSYSNKSFEKTQNIRGDGDYWIVKMDKQGKIEWDKTIGGNSADNFKSVIKTLDGGYAIIGESASNISVEKSENSRGDVDYWIVKLDNAGNIQWDKTIGGNGIEVIDNIVQTSDSGYVLAGSSISNISGEKTENSRGNFDIWVVKLNKNGKKVWDKTIGGSDYDLSSGVQVTSDGGLIIGGFSGSNKSGEKSENNKGIQSDYWIIKLNKNGNIVWDKTIGGSSDDYCHSVYETRDGGYILGGSSNSIASADKTQNNWGGYDYWLVKINSSGKKIWDKTLGSIGDDYFNTMLISKEDGYLLGGGSNGNISANKTEDSRGSFDYWLVNTNANGNLLWDKTIGGFSDEYIYGLAEPQPNTFIVGGFSYSPESADKKAFNRGGADFWMVALKYNSLLKSADTSLLKKQSVNALKRSLVIYPNPARDNINITIDGISEVILTNASGKTLLTKRINHNANINVSALAEGMYYLKNIATGETQPLVIYH